MVLNGKFKLSDLHIYLTSETMTKLGGSQSKSYVFVFSLSLHSYSDLFCGPHFVLFTPDLVLLASALIN